MKEHVHFGDVDVPKEAYDKLETVVITMNADGIKSESELIRYLSLLLNREMPQEERVEALKNEYHIQVDDPPHPLLMRSSPLRVTNSPYLASAMCWNRWRRRRRMKLLSNCLGLEQKQN